MPSTSKVNAASLASTLQLQEQQRDFIYSVIALGMKLGLLLISAVSVFKLGIASHQRVERHSEISAVLAVESARLASLQEDFDELFTIGGDSRLIDKQDHWIAPNRVRIIWR